MIGNQFVKIFIQGGVRKNSLPKITKILIAASLCIPLANNAFPQTEAQKQQSILNHINLAEDFIQLKNNDLEVAHFDSARMIAEGMETDCYEKAFAFRLYADLQIRNGSLENGHDYYWKALRTLENVGGHIDEQAYCHYQLATGYYQMGDIDAVAGETRKLKQLTDQSGDLSTAYSYYSVGMVYYVMLSQVHPENPDYHDSTAYFSLKSIGVIEKMSDKEILAAQIKPVWNYYNHAVLYDPDDGEPCPDSIMKYLDLAEAMVSRFDYRYMDWERDECYISIGDERAWLYYYKGDYAKAEATMLDVIRLIDTVEQYSPNSVLIEREQACQFLSNLYKETGDLAKALQYEKLKNETHDQRYDIEKQAAMKELRVQYEVEKQESEIKHLQNANRAARKMSWLLMGLLAFSVALIVLAVWIFRQRKANMMQQLYEKELENENMQQEMSHQAQEKALLTEEYEKLKTLASKNEEYAERYKADLDDLQRRIDASPTKALIGHIAETIRSSRLLKEKDKDGYLARLNGLEVEQMDRLFASATGKLTSLDTKYILCFMAGMDTEHVAELFGISIDSVYSVRHRVRRKFDKNASLPF